MFNKPMNEAADGIMLCTDDPQHIELRRIFAAPLLPGSVIKLKRRFQELTKTLVATLKQRDEFDVVTDLAQILPLTVVTELVGLTDEGKDNMLDWASAIFDAFGPLPNQRTEQGLAVTRQVLEYVHSPGTQKNLKKGGLGARLFDFVDKGRISQHVAESMLVDYLTPALDTTISGVSALVWKLGQHPEQWQRLRQNPSLIPNAISETIRLESPIRAFARHAVEDYAVDGVTIPAGSRVAMLYGCANRDERYWDNADQFNLQRKNTDHVGFGFGSHMCAGMHLARLEISCVAEAMVEQIECIEVGQPEHIVHNTIRALGQLTASFG
jgi:cytochrome P450